MIHLPAQSAAVPADLIEKPANIFVTPVPGDFYQVVDGHSRSIPASAAPASAESAPASACPSRTAK